MSSSPSLPSPYRPEPLEAWAAGQTITTLPQLFEATVNRASERPFLGAKRDGSYRYQTYAEVAVHVETMAAALCHLGLQPGDRVAQISGNRPEWVITDLATMTAGGVHVPLYSTLSTEAFSFILRDSGARWLVLETAEHWHHLLACQGQLDALEGVITHHPAPASFAKPTWSWEAFLALGREHFATQHPVLKSRRASLQATDVCSLVYTSGTTGEPKAAMLMHGNFVHNALSVRPSIEVEPGDTELSFLPLSHVFERTLYYLVVHLGATIAYAQSMETVRDDLLEVRPHLVASVPRLYEKIMAAVVEKARNAPNLRRTRGHLFDWALETGRRHSRAQRHGHVPWALQMEYRLAHQLVFQKIHQATGGRIKVFASGGAALRADVAEFFLASGFTMIEGYGLTETSPVITMNPPHRPKLGTVGLPIPGVEVRIAEDGEILTRGPHVMLGYFGKPEATRDVIDEDGWFHTGDIGEIDREGYLKITDRKKEILVLSNGKNVAPAPIEQALQASPYIEQAVVLGNDRNFVAALLVPHVPRLAAWCQERGISSEPSSMLTDPQVLAFLQGEVGQLCQRFSHYEQVKKIALLERELSQSHGELTPTLKLRRRVVDRHFAEQIAKLYQATPS